MNLLNPANIESFGIVLMFNTALPCLLGAFCFYMSGAPYVAQKQAMEVDKEEAITVAS